MSTLKYHDGTAWVDIATAGPKGARGAPGPAGPVGPAGTIAALNDFPDVDTVTTPPEDDGALTFSGGLWTSGTTSVITDHGLWAGQTDDDHLQYFDTARGDARYATVAEGLLTPATNWADYGSGYVGLFVTRTGEIATIDCLFKPTVAVTIAHNASSTVATIPVGFRPFRPTVIGIVFTNIAPGNNVTRIDLKSTGEVAWTNNSGASMTLPAGGYLGICMAYRCVPA